MTTIDPTLLALGREVMTQLGINPGFPDNITEHHKNKTKDKSNSVKGGSKGRDNTPTPKGDGIKKQTDLVDLGVTAQLDNYVTDNNNKTSNDIQQDVKGAIKNQSDLGNWGIAGALTIGLYLLTR